MTIDVTKEGALDATGVRRMVTRFGHYVLDVEGAARRLAGERARSA